MELDPPISEYQAPKLVEYGSLAELTQAHDHGHPFDHTATGGAVTFDPHHLTFSAG